MEARRAGRREAARLPEDVSRGESGVTAEVFLALRHEPSEVEPVGPRLDERRHGQVHLGGDGLHPPRVASSVEQADRRRIPGERTAGEGVNHDDGNGHPDVF